MHQVNTNLIPNLLDETKTPNWYASGSMIDDEKPRSIRFPQSLWDAIDRDAERCKRSAVKQMEAVLTEYYRLASVAIPTSVMDEMRDRPDKFTAVTKSLRAEMTDETKTKPKPQIRKVK